MDLEDREEEIAMVPIIKLRKMNSTVGVNQLYIAVTKESDMACLLSKKGGLGVNLVSG